MNEIEALADRCSVFRNGRHIETFARGDRSRDEIISLMIGREIEGQYPPKVPRVRPGPLLSIRDLSWAGRLKGVSLEAGRGEILGLGGLDGQGQKELLLALFGVLRGVKGSVSVSGQTLSPTSPRAAKNGRIRMALVPEDRKSEGLILSMSIADNLAMASLDGLSRGPFIAAGRLRAVVTRAIEQLQIKVGEPSDAVSTLSGGNQQKVVIAKWLATGPEIILLNDPTRGIDVGTKQEIYRLMRELAEAGACIVFYSTDYEELIGCCDRVAVLYDGRVVQEFEGDAITEHNLLASALNIAERPEASHV
jgi:ribose transport system ATP-binding protein